MSTSSDNQPPIIPSAPRGKSTGQKFATWSAKGVGDYLIASQIKSLAKKVSERLDKEIERGHAVVPFLIMLSLAIAKDCWDFIWNEIYFILIFIIGLGQAALPYLVVIKTILNIFLVALLYYNLIKNGWFIRTKVKLLGLSLKAIFFIFSAAEFIPVLEAVPFETICVLYLWRSIKKRAKKAEEKKEKLKRMTLVELKTIDSSIETIDDEEEDKTSKKPPRPNIQQPNYPTEQNRNKEPYQQPMAPINLTPEMNNKVESFRDKINR